jgi:hypothetical protein
VARTLDDHQPAPGDGLVRGVSVAHRMMSSRSPQMIKVGIGEAK